MALRVQCVSAQFVSEPQGTLNVVEHEFSLLDEQWLSKDVVAERGPPSAVEHEFPHVVERELPDFSRAIKHNLPQVSSLRSRVWSSGSSLKKLMR